MSSSNKAMEDQASVKRLVLVKRTYLDGIEKAAHQHNYCDQMLAVVNLFLAVETLMGAVVLAVEEQPSAAIGTKGYKGGQPSPEQVSGFNVGDPHKFEQLFNQVVAILRSREALGGDQSLFPWDALNRLRIARNDAQHGGKAPHPSDLPELSKIAEQFIDAVLATHFFAFATSLSEVSLADLVEDDVLREYLKHAEAALVRGELKGCALLLRVAFLLGRLKRRYNWWKDRHGNRIHDDYDAGHRISEQLRPRRLRDRDSALLPGIVGQVVKLPPLFDNWVLGLDSVERHRLFELTPRLVQYPADMRNLPASDEMIVVPILDRLVQGREDWTGPGSQTAPSENDSLWLFDFTTETILRWEREQRDQYTPIDLGLLDALPKLESVVSA
jgi:hypothetical protein